MVFDEELFSSCPCVKQIKRKAKVEDHNHSGNAVESDVSFSNDYEEENATSIIDDGRKSSFNSRPPTVSKKNSGTVSILQVRRQTP